MLLYGILRRFFFFISVLRDVWVRYPDRRRPDFYYPLKLVIFIQAVLSFLFAGCLNQEFQAPPVKILTALDAARYEDTVEIGVKYDFSRPGIKALYSDGSAISIDAGWYLNGAKIEPDNFYAPESETSLMLNALYQEGGIARTLEIKLNAVKAFSAVYFSDYPCQDINTCEIIAGRASPVLKFTIGSPVSESLIIRHLSFSLIMPAVTSLNGGIVSSAVILTGGRLWQASKISASKIEFEFETSRLFIPVNSVADLTLSIAFNDSALPVIAEGKTYIEITSDFSSLDACGEFFGMKVMNDIRGLPIRSRYLSIKPPAERVYDIMPDCLDAHYSPVFYELPAGGPVCFTVSGPGVQNDNLAFIVRSGKSSGSYSLTAALHSSESSGRLFSAGRTCSHSNFDFSDHIPSFTSLDGQDAVDMNMREFEKELLKNHTAPDSAKSPALMRGPGGYSENDLCSFHVINVKNYQWHTITAEVSASGRHCYIFEEIGMEPRYRKLSKKRAQEIARIFDDKIYPGVTGVFGSEPNPGIDNDHKIFILFTRIVNEGTALGYFSAINQYPRYENGIEQFRYSNEKEIIFSAVFDEKSEFSNENEFFNLLLNVTAHEFQHMINWRYHSENGNYEETWVNEGLSMLAEDIAGYGYQYNFSARRISEFFAAADSYSLINFKYLDRGSYGFSYLFFRYLYERGAVPENMVKSSKSGIANVEAEIIRAKIAPDFDTAFEDFLAALYFSSEGIASGGHYVFRFPLLKGVFNFAGAFNIELKGMKSVKMTVPDFYTQRPLHEYCFNIVTINRPSGIDAVTDKLNFYFEAESGGELNILPIRLKK